MRPLFWTSLALLAVGCESFDDASDKTPIVADPGVGETGDTDGDTGSDSSNDTGDSAIQVETGETGDPRVDADGDGFYSTETGGDDCDDGDERTFPGAVERCDGRDNDCDGTIEGEGDNDADATLDCEDYCPVFASWGASGDGRVTHPIGTIQDAVDLAGSTGCNEVRAYYGTYSENVNFNGYGVNVESISGSAATTINGGGFDSCVIIEEDGDGDLDEDNARISGFTLTNGGGSTGAGIRIKECSPSIEDNIITDNVTESEGVGGGIRIYNGSPSIVGNEITNNDACYSGPESGCDGGAIDIRGGAPTITDNLMAGNSAGDGGAIWLAYSEAYIANNWIVGNMAEDSAEEDEEGQERDGQGGGIDVQIGGANGGTIITNNIIADNSASALGGGIVVYEPHVDYPNVTITNNIIAFNSVLETDWGAGFAQWNGTVPVVYNNIIYGNVGVGAYGDDDVATWMWLNNDIYGNFPDFDGTLSSASGTGNLGVDPEFTAASNDGDWTNDDFHLKATSVCIDAGKADVYDTDGSTSDMGAYGGPAGGW